MTDSYVVSGRGVGRGAVLPVDGGRSALGLDPEAA
jgi:hypothetical protein